jgi:uncharacterized protein (DUF1778 family)
MLENSIRAARKEVTLTKQLKLSRQDAELFLAALENPSSPHPKLMQAFKNYDKLLGK